MNSWHHKTRSAQIRELSRCDMMRRKWARKLAKMAGKKKHWVVETNYLNAYKAYVKTKEVSDE